MPYVVLLTTVFVIFTVIKLLEMGLLGSERADRRKLSAAKAAESFRPADCKKPCSADWRKPLTLQKP